MMLHTYVNAFRISMHDDFCMAYCYLHGVFPSIIIMMFMSFSDMTGYGHTELFKVTCYNFQPSRAC